MKENITPENLLTFLLSDEFVNVISRAHPNRVVPNENIHHWNISVIFYADTPVYEKLLTSIGEMSISVPQMSIIREKQHFYIYELMFEVDGEKFHVAFNRELKIIYSVKISQIVMHKLSSKSIRIPQHSKDELLLQTAFNQLDSAVSRYFGESIGDVAENADEHYLHWNRVNLSNIEDIIKMTSLEYVFNEDNLIYMRDDGQMYRLHLWRRNIEPFRGFRQITVQSQTYLAPVKDSKMFHTPVPYKEQI